MAVKTDAALTTQANIIKNETTNLANTADRVGTMFVDMIDSKKNVSGAVTQVKVSLSSAEILALFTTPKTLVAAQGAGTFINVLSIAMRLNFNSIAYATNTTLRAEIGSFNPVVTTNTILAGADNDFNVSCPTQTLSVSGSPDWVNTQLRLKVLTGNPTAGDSTLDVYVTYTVITL